MIASPQFVLNPIKAMLNQFSIELALTEPQRQQIIPIIKGEVPKLEALKKDKTLKPEQKLEQLKQISDEVDSKVTPLLDQEQQKKFQEELQKPSPNPTLAGAYLGIVAKQPVTPEMVQKVGATLCVSVSTPQADAIAAAAEDQRLNGRNTAQQGKR
jgi:hypothetical protein